MNVGGTGELEETRTPLHTEDIRPPHYSFRFTCKTSGVHSIQLTVYDRANNSARARQLFNYDGISKMTSTMIAALQSQICTTGYTGQIYWTRHCVLV